MTTSESINEIAAALCQAQRLMKNATLNKVNPHFKSKYADLAGIRDTVIPALTTTGICVVQTLDDAAVITRLIHTSGQWIQSRCPIPQVPDMQKMGSAITYARRYSLSAICGIAADEDDDGNAAVPTAEAHARNVSKMPPTGYLEWFTDLTATADEGTQALKAAWEASKPEFRNHLTGNDNAKWEALKKRAALAKQPQGAA